MKKLKVADYMSKDVIKISEDATVHDAIERMLEKGIHGLVVVDQSNNPLGLVTVDDLLILIEKGEGGTDMVVGEFMSRVLYTTEPGETLQKALELMNRNRIRRLPVTSDGKMVGMITSNDILRAFQKVYARECK